jgi:hypothetical protein
LDNQLPPVIQASAQATRLEISHTDKRTEIVGANSNCHVRQHFVIFEIDERLTCLAEQAKMTKRKFNKTACARNITFAVLLITVNPHRKVALHIPSYKLYSRVVQHRVKWTIYQNTIQPYPRYGQRAFKVRPFAASRRIRRWVRCEDLRWRRSHSADVKFSS